jgi:hypothetical protein
MDNPQEIKNLIIKKLIEDKQYDKVLAHLGNEEKDSGLTKLIKPMSAVADILTENAKGAFMEDLEKRLDEATTKGNEELRKDLEEAHATLKTELKQAINTDRDELSSDILERVTEAQTRLQETLARYADEIVTNKADAIFDTLAEQARLTEDEIQEIVDDAALSVETQIAGIIGDYIAEAGITTAQITDFDKAVRKLIPPAQQVTWDSIVGKPNMSQGGTNTNVVKALIAEALAGFTPGSGVPPGGTTGQVLTKVSNADGDADWQSLTGGGDMLASVYDPANKAEQVLTIGDSSSFATSAQGALADTAVQPAAIANFETTTQLNTRDTNNRNRANHTGTQTASTISDFQTTVSANTDVAANTAARHDAVTLAGSPNYLTIVGQVITRGLINLASHVTGKLPFANLADGTAHSVVGRSGSGAGDVANITAGNDTILSRSGSGNVTFNNASTVRTILNVADGANNYVHPNHTGDVTSTGDGATVAQPVMITGKTTVTPASGDFVLISDASDGGALKKVNVDDLGGGGGGNTFNDLYRAQSGMGTTSIPALTGAVNGTNTTFTVPEGQYVAGTLQVYLNGQLMGAGSTTPIAETTPASGVFDFDVAPQTGDVIFVTYQTQVTNAGSLVYAVGTEDIEITDSTKGLILESPDATRWRITIGNDGALIATSL